MIYSLIMLVVEIKFLLFIASIFFNTVYVLHTKTKMLWKEIYTYFLNV